MSKLFKKIGFGPKSNPPQPPRPDYLDQRGGNSEHRLSGLHRSPENSDCFDGINSSLHDKYETTASSCLSQATTSTAFEDESYRKRRSKGQSVTPPRLEEEYSDPLDVKKDISASMLGAVGGALPIVEDDYSVPYEVREMFNATDDGRVYDDVPQTSLECEPGPSAKPPFPSNEPNSTPSVSDGRPLQDYDEPWEWSASNKLALLEGALQDIEKHHQQDVIESNSDETHTSPLHQQTNIQDDVISPNEVSQRRVSVDGTIYDLGRGKGNDKQNGTDAFLSQQVNDQVVQSDDVTRQDNIVVTADDEPLPAESENLGNYEEPWDLENVQKRIDDAAKRAAGDDDVTQDTQVTQSEPIKVTPETCPQSQPIVRSSEVNVEIESNCKNSPARLKTDGCHGHQVADQRPQEGYEKPWDWKPHQKDDRGQQGYEKPWDWKPHMKDERGLEGYEKPWDWKAHQKDDRPVQEYDEPWERKSLRIEQELLKTRGAKVAQESSVKQAEERPESESSATNHATIQPENVDSTGMTSSNPPLNQSIGHQHQKAEPNEYLTDESTLDPSHSTSQPPLQPSHLQQRHKSESPRGSSASPASSSTRAQLPQTSPQFVATATNSSPSHKHAASSSQASSDSMRFTSPASPRTGQAAVTSSFGSKTNKSPKSTLAYQQQATPRAGPSPSRNGQAIASAAARVGKVMDHHHVTEKQDGGKQDSKRRSGSGDAKRGERRKGNEGADRRPPEEYDEPWDSLKTRTITGISNQQKREENVRVGHTAWGERVDPSLPLDKQCWYHGAISRLQAEALLRVHKEGSYLIRQSESNKIDFSLSLKSSRGFMHMKIITRDGRFILGQFSQPFDTIPQMVHHYSVSKLPIKGAEHMTLIYPVTNDLL